MELGPENPEYEAPSIVEIGSVRDLTLGTRGAGQGRGRERAGGPGRGRVNPPGLS